MNYIFVNAPKSQSDIDRLLGKLEQAVASSVLRKMKSESIAVNADSHAVNAVAESRISGIF